MSERFFSSKPITGDRVVLDGAEAHHLLHVMRASTGEQVSVFDGRGAEFSAVVESTKRTEVELRIVERREFDRELPFPLTVGIALPKGDRQKWLVEKLTELGVTTLVPLVTERCVAVPSESALERLRRAVIEAAKQCGRNRLMKISTAQAWDRFVIDDSGLVDKSGFRRFIAHPGGMPLSEVALAQSAAIQVAVGPEGGFSGAEVNAAVAAGWQIVSLGPRILRVETAAIAVASALGLRR